MSVVRATGLGLLLPLLQGGCTVTAVSATEDIRPRNSCTSSDSCGRDESCLEGICQALNGELEAVMLTATPSVDSTLPYLTYVTHLGDLPTREAADVVWPGASNLTGSIELPKGHCYPSFLSEDPNTSILESRDGTLPVSAMLTLRQRLLGLSQQTYLAKTVDAPVMGYTFGMQVPSGEYDVYLAPPYRQMPGCVVPPQLFRGVSIGVNENSNPPAGYRFQFAAISKLVLHLLWPAESARRLEGWSVDIIEPQEGNPISTRAVLAEPSTTRQGKLDYLVELSSSAVADSTSSSSGQSAMDLLRLQPPSGLIAPTIYLERSALGLLQDPDLPVDLSIFTRYPSAVTVQGQMTRGRDGSTVGGVVTVVSKEIYGIDAGVFGSYQTREDVNSSGVFQVVVPPGRYAVRAEPNVDQSEPLSSLETEWVVPADTPRQFGKLLELAPTAVIVGQSRIQGVQVQALPVPRNVLPFQDAFGVRPFTPRPAVAYADETGQFSLRVDKTSQSRVNVTLRPPEELGYAWFVRTGIVLEGPRQDLARVSPPLPSVLSATGSVLQNGKSVPLAYGTVRAYAYLNDNFQYTRDPSLAATVVQVAETRADAAGKFRLLLPSSIDAPK